MKSKPTVNGRVAEKVLLKGGMPMGQAGRLGEVRSIDSGAKHHEQNPREHAANYLASWKEIASYMNRTTRTVQRWEALEGLPVRRHTHRRASTVFAHKNEIDLWLETRDRRELIRGSSPGIVESDSSIDTLKELLKMLIFGLELLDAKRNRPMSDQAGELAAKSIRR